MKMNSEVHNISADAIVCVLKATETFLEFLIKNSFEVSLTNNRKSLKVNIFNLSLSFSFSHS
jgi:histone H3/H4